MPVPRVDSNQELKSRRHLYAAVTRWGVVAVLVRAGASTASGGMGALSAR